MQEALLPVVPASASPFVSASSRRLLSTLDALVASCRSFAALLARGPAPPPPTRDFPSSRA